MAEFMDLTQALEITVELARENILEERQCDDDAMLADRARQIQAVDRVAQSFARVVVHNLRMP